MTATTVEGPLATTNTKQDLSTLEGWLWDAGSYPTGSEGLSSRDSLPGAGGLVALPA